MPYLVQFGCIDGPYRLVHLHVGAGWDPGFETPAFSKIHRIRNKSLQWDDYESGMSKGRESQRLTCILGEILFRAGDDLDLPGEQSDGDMQ